MRHRMFLSLLLAFLGFLGVRAADESRTADVTFDKFGSMSYSMTEVKTIDWTSTTGTVYNITYFAAQQSSGSLVLRKRKEGPGYVEFPSFGKKVEKIVITTPNTSGTARSVNIFDLNGKGGAETPINGSSPISLNNPSWEYTVDITEQISNSKFKIVSTGGGNTEIAKIEFFFVEDAAISPGLSFDPKGPFKYSITDSKTFKAPTFNNPNNLPDITFASSNENVLKVDAANGNVTLGGSTGTAVISATYGGGSKNGVKYEAETVRYTFTVYDVTASIAVPKDQMEEGSIVGLKFQDDTKLVEFGFTKDATAENIQYASGDKFIRFRPNTSVSLESILPDYVIDKVIITNRNSTGLNPVEVSAGDYTPASGDSYDNVWSFDGENVSKATLKYVGTVDRLGVNNIVVTIRKPRFTITPAADITVNSDATLNPVAEYFTLSNFGFGGSSADYAGKLVYTVDDAAVANNVAKITGNNIVLLGENGEATVTATYPGGDVYGTTSASFKITVTGAVVMTATTEDVELALYGTNGDLSKKAPIVLKHKDKVLDSFSGQFTYTSSDNNIATVDAEGVINAVGEGNAVVTVTYAGEDYEMAPATINVTVKDLRPQPVVKFTADKVIYLTNSKDAFVAPTLTESLENVVWTSSNENLAAVNNGVITLNEGVTGKAVITAEIVACETTKGAKASYTIVVADPKGELALDPSSQGYANGSINSTVKNDAAELVSFAFNQGNESATRPAYSVSSKYITFNTGNTLTITSKNPAYYISEVKFVYANGTSLTTCTHPEGTDLSADGTVWNFDNADLQTAVLTNKGVAAQISEIIVVLRLARLNIAHTEASVARQINDPAITVADYFTVTDHNGQAVTGLDIVYTSDNADLPVVDGVVTLNKVGDAKITAEFKGNDTYEAASASFTLSVSETAPVKISFNEDMDKTLDLYTENGPQTLDVLANITAVEGKELGTLAEVKKNITVEKADTDNNVISIEDGVVTAVNPGKAIVNVIFAGDDHNAKTTASFEVEVVDNRQKLVLAFNPLTTTYDMSAGKAFVTPTLALPAGLTASDLKWESSKAEVLTVENGIVTFAEKVNGVQTVTVTASYEDYADNNKNWAYLPTSASYTVKVIGDAAWLDETPNLSGDVKVRGYIVGSIKNGIFKDSSKTSFDSDNIAIALNENETNGANVVRVVLTGANQKALNLQDNKKLLGSQIIVTGNSRSAKEITTLTSYTLLKSVDYTISDEKVPTNFATVVVNVPAAYKGDYNIAVEPSVGVVIDGNSIAFPEKDVNYTVTVSNVETLPYLETSKTFNVEVSGFEEAEDVTFYFAHDPNTGSTPHIIIKSNKGAEYVAEGHRKGEWHEMTPVADKYIGYERQVFSYTAKVPLSELSENYKEAGKTNAKRRAPQYDEETKSSLITNGSSVSASDKSNLNVYVAAGSPVDEDGNPNLTDDSVVSIPNAPVGDDFIYASSDENGKLYVWQKDEYGLTYVGLLENENINSQNNYWTGEIPVAGVTSLSVILTTGISENGSEPAGTVFEAAGANNGSTLASGINAYTTWVTDTKKGTGTPGTDGFNAAGWGGKALYNACVAQAKKTTSTEEAYNAFMQANYYSVAEPYRTAASQTLKDSGKYDADKDYTPVNLAVSALNGGNDQNLLYSSVELSRPSGSSDGVYEISFGYNPDDIATDVKEINTADADGEVMWFNLQGERLAQPVEGVVMIRVQGNKAQKVIINN